MVEQDFNGEFLPDKHDPTRNVPLWAQYKAREWLKKNGVTLAEYSEGLAHYPWIEVTEEEEASLAALLVEVGTATTLVAIDVERARVLADVRRVVAALKVEYTSGTSGCADARLCCDEILARLIAAIRAVLPAKPEPFSDAACGPRYAEPKEGK